MLPKKSMNSFLEDVAHSIAKRYGEDLSKLEVIFPTNRAAIYFKSAITPLVKKLPKTQTIDHFIRSLGSKQSSAHNFTLVNLLYESYQKYHSGQSFEEFYSFGKLLLADFDAIDKYLVDAQALYSIVSDSKELDYSIGVGDEAKEMATEFWRRVDYKGEKGNKEREFVKIWESLYSIYLDFNELLEENEIAYGGKIYRQAATRVQESEDLDPIFKNHLIFVGLNALSRSEQEILSRLESEHRADFIWDFDPNWQGFSSIEASYFINKNLSLLPQAEYFTKSCRSGRESDIKIRVIPSTLESAQVKIATSIIEKEIEKGNNLERTAIILPDESLITPLLYSINPAIERLNISIGYPLAATPIMPLIEGLILLKRRCKMVDNKALFYHKDVVKILNHLYIAKHMNHEICLEDYSQTIYFSSEEIHEIAPEVDFIFDLDNISLSIGNYLLSTINYLLNSLTTPEIEQEEAIEEDSERREEPRDREEQEEILGLGLITDIITRVNALTSESRNKITSSMYITLLKSEISGASLELEGYSGAGLQIIGILESRSLDFDNIIMLSLSDDIFPASKPESSYIPQLLLQGYGMPTVAEKSAIWSYYFYRLLQRCNSLYLLYCNSASGGSTGEPSRYIMQLKYSLPYNYKELEVNYSQIKSTTLERIVIQKSEEVISNLKRTKHYPSMINQYIKCPLAYYFKYIAKLKEPDEVMEENLAIITGNLVHNTLERLYKPLVKRVNVVGLIQKITKHDIEEALDEVILETLTERNRQDAAGLDILRQSALRMIEGIVHHDQKSNQLEIIEGVEESYTILVDQKYRVSGKIDRLDRLKDGSLRVIDYKSGKIDLDFATIEELFDMEYQGKLKREGSLQLLLYAWITREQMRCDVGAELLSTRSLASEKQQGVYEGSISINKSKVKTLSPELLTSIKSLTLETLDSLCDIETPFAQCQNQNNCTYCSYKALCR